MINVTTLTTALYNLLAADTALQTAGCRVARSTRINFDPAVTPWLGVYPGNVTTQARAMGGRAWNNTAELQVVIQASSLSSDGAAASDILEDIIDKMHDVVNADLSLGIVGVRVMSMSREYSYVVLDSEGTGELFMPQAVIKIQIEMRS